MNLKDKILKYASFTLVFLSPLVFWSNRLYPHISSKTFFIYGFIEIIFFTWIYALIADRSYRMTKKALLWSLPVVAFVTWMTIAGVIGADFSQSFWSMFGRGTGLLTLYHCLAFVFVIASLVYKLGNKYIQSLLEWFIAGAVILALSVWIGPGGLGIKIKALNDGNEGGLIGNSSLAAVYIIFSIIFSLFLIFKNDVNKTKKKLLIGSILLMVLSPLLINISGLFNGYGLLGSARSSVVALPVTLGFFFASLLAFSKEKKYRVLGIIGIIVGVVAVSLFWVNLVNPSTKLHNTFSQVARGSRFIFWDSAQKAINEHPILGYGPENYSIAFQEHFNPDILLDQNSAEGWADRAHNIYYDLGVQGGYPAIIIYILVMISLLYCVYLLQKKDKINNKQSAILVACIVGYIFQNLFVFDSTHSLLTFYMLAGILFGLTAENTASNNIINSKLNNSDKNTIAFFLSIPFIICWIFFAYLPARKSVIYADTFRSLVSETEKDYSKLLGLPPIGQDWDTSQMAFDAYRLYVENAKKIKSDEKLRQLAVKNINSLLKHLYIVAETNKTDYRLYITLVYLENSQIYFSGQQYQLEKKEKLLAILDKAKTLSKNNPNVYWNIAQVKIWSGDFTGVEEAYRKAMTIAPHLPGSYSLFMTYAKAVGNQKLFNEIMIKAKENVKDFTFS